MIARCRQAVLGCAVVLWAMAAGAQAQTIAPEAAIKAAFLYKFAGYVEWPPVAFARGDSPFVIGVHAADEVAAELERIAPARTIGTRRIVVQRVREGDPLAGIHMLFIGRGQASPGTMLRAARGPILTVTETARGFEMGSAINFVPSDENIAFEVSLDSAERNGLRISSRMLAVARRVVPRS